MIARFRPSVARGSVDAPPSKTLAHRFLLAAALSESPSVVRGLCLSEDVLATIDCARSLGADVRLDGTDAHVDPQALPPSDLFPCRESGSTLRFFLPAALGRILLDVPRDPSSRGVRGCSNVPSACTRTSAGTRD